MFGRFRKRAENENASPATTPPSSATPPSSDAAVEARARELAKIPLFLDLSKRELHRVAVTAVERDYAPGDVLMRQDHPGAGLFTIVRGSVRITQHEGGSEEYALATQGAGDVLGEMALLDDLPRSATVTAVEPTHALLLAVQDFRAILREDPDITIKLLAVLSRRLRRAEARQI